MKIKRQKAVLLAYDCRFVGFSFPFRIEQAAVTLLPFLMLTPDTVPIPNVVVCPSLFVNAPRILSLPLMRMTMTYCVLKKKNLGGRGNKSELYTYKLPYLLLIIPLDSDLSGQSKTSTRNIHSDPFLKTIFMNKPMMT